MNKQIRNFSGVLLLFLCSSFFNFAFAENEFYVISDTNGKIISGENFPKNTLFFSSYNGKNLVIKKYAKGKEDTKIINTDGKYILNNLYDYISPVTSQYYLVEKNKKSYIVNSSGVKVITLKASSISETINENCFGIKDFASKSTGNSGTVKDNFMAKHPGIVYNNELKKIYEGDITYCEKLNSDYIFIKINDDDGIIIDKNGNILMSGVQNCERCDNDIFSVKTHTAEGLYDITKKKYIINGNIKEINNAGDNNTIVKYDIKGEPQSFLADKNYNVFKKNNGYAYITPGINVFTASSDGLYTNTVLNGKSKILFSAKGNENIENASGKYVVINKNGKYSLKNIKGKEVLSSKYDDIILTDNSVITKNAQNFEILNLKLKPVKKFTAASAIYNGISIYISDNEKYKLLNSSDGKIIFESNYMEEISVNTGRKNEKFYIAEKNGKKGVINSKGAAVINFEYDDIIPAVQKTANKEEIVFSVKQGEKWGIKDILTGNFGGFIYQYPPVKIFDNFVISEK